MNVFPKRLSERRRALHLTQGELAELVGSTQRQISKYELGQNDPTAGVLSRLAEVLQTSTDWLVGRTDVVDRPLRGMADLDEFERSVITLIREKPREQHEKIIEILKLL